MFLEIQGPIPVAGTGMPIQWRADTNQEKSEHLLNYPFQFGGFKLPIIKHDLDVELTGSSHEGNKQGEVRNMEKGLCGG